MKCGQKIKSFVFRQELADSLGISYIETSAKDSTNVKQAFGLMVENPAPTLPKISDSTNNPSEVKVVQTSSAYESKEYVRFSFSIKKPLNILVITRYNWR
jgi:hypothetical protein